MGRLGGDEGGDEDWVQRLVDVRKLMGWSQRKLAAEFCVSPAAVSQWESHQRAIPGPARRLIEIYEQTLGMVDAPRKPNKINASWVARTLRLSTASAKVATRLAGSSLRSLFASNVRALEIKAASQSAIGLELSETLGELRGLSMKLGQMVSYVGIGLPEPIRHALSDLQQSASPMSSGDVDAVFMEAMGDTPKHVFAEWEEEPFAAGSIGQLHRASLPDGQCVAVKVQYPEVLKSLEADLAHAKLVHRLGGLLFQGMKREQLMTELRDRIIDECDYTLEATNQQEFATNYADDSVIMIPKVHRNVSTRTVLTTDFVEGLRFKEFVGSATQGEKDKAGELIFRFALESLFVHCIFNADPHPGNYIFLPHGVAFLDFGCVKRFTPEFITTWCQHNLAVWADDQQAVREFTRKMGFVLDEERFNHDAQWEMVRVWHEPWLSEQPFRFNRHYVEKCGKVVVEDNPNRFTAGMPADWLFTNRLQWGVWTLLAELEACADWSGIMRDIFQRCLERWDTGS